MTVTNISSLPISASFSSLMQISSSNDVYDALGNQKTNLNVTASYALSASYVESGGSSVLTSDLTASVSLGGIDTNDKYPVNTSLESILRDLISPFNPAVISSLTLKNGASTVSSYATKEVGTYVIYNSCSIAISWESQTNLYSASFSQSDATNATDFSYYIGDNPGYASPTAIISKRAISTTPAVSASRDSAGTITYTFNIAQTNVAAGTSGKTRLTATSTFVYPIYYGMSSDVYTTGPEYTVESESGITKDVITQPSSKSYGYSGTSKYMYIMYPTSYGDLNSIKDSSNFEVLSSFTKYTSNIASADNGWAGVSYNIYKSNSLVNVTSQTYTFTW